MNETKKHQFPKRNGRRSPNAKVPSVENETLRSVYAAYLNMARMNLYNTLRFIGQTCGLEDNVQEGRMQEMSVANFASHPHGEKRQNVKRALFKHLPVLQSMTQSYVTPEHLFVEDDDLQTVLKNIISVVTDQRNYLTHADPYNSDADWQRQKDIEKELLPSLDKAFMSAKRKVKRVFDYSVKDMLFIDGFERMVDTGEKVVVMEKGKRREKNVFREASDYFFRLRTPEGDCLSSVGLAFLVCKLLNKKHATIFAQRTGLFRGPGQNGFSPFNKRENEIMFNIFCAERIRLPKGRMESSTDTMALGLDMLAELQKCPSELFETFCPADRKLFEVKKENAASNTADEDINLMRRHGDRFARLAMQYIDSFNADPDHKNKRESAPLPDMAFQVSLGKYRYSFYNRAPFHVGMEDRLRVLQKEINGFGPLTKIEEQRRTQYDAIIRQVNDDGSDLLYDADTALSRPYLTDHHASYAITADRIGLMWNENQNDAVLDSNTLCHLPALPVPSATNDPKQPWKVNPKDIGHNIAPKAWLSIYDLPALVFLHRLGGKPAQVIKGMYAKLNNLFDDIAEGRREPYFKGQLPQGQKERQERIKKLREKLDEPLENDYGLHACDIPDKVVEYLIGAGLASNEMVAVQQAEERFQKWCDERVKSLKESLDRRIEHFDNDVNLIGDRMNRIGRKGYVDLRPGSLARYLSKDMMAMVDPKNGKKPSGLDFALLQTAIATYHGSDQPLGKTELGSIIKKAFPWQNHPFLPDIMSQQVVDTIDLYKKYQQAKSRYFGELLNDRQYASAYFLREAHRNQMAKTRTYMRDVVDDNGSIKDEGLAHRYRHTLQLPDGLFTNAIREQLSQLESPHIKAALAEKTGGNSAAYLLNVWFTYVEGDKSQPFYRSDVPNRYKRHYKIFETLYPKEDSMDDGSLSAKLKGGAESIIRRDINKYIENLKITEKIYDKKQKAKVPVDRDATSAEKESERKKLMHQLRDLQRNERTIRRHRNEDILLFLMAKKLLLSGGASFMKRATSDGSSRFLLQNIVPIGANHDEENNLLNQKVSLSTRITLLNDQNKPIKDEDKKPVQRTIHQNEIKLKNYGDFFRFLYDSRIGILLSQQADTEEGISRENLEKELDAYDTSRAEAFKILHRIERQIIRQHPELKDPQSEQFANAKGVPYRNNFASLLSLSTQFFDAEGNLSFTAKMLTELRNAYSHNKYIENIDRLLQDDKLDLPKVAENLAKWMDEISKQ